MTYRVYLSPPDVGELEREYVADALSSGWVAPLGPHVDAFEAEVAAYVGVKHAIALSSGTAGLHLGLLALGVQAGDEVVVPSMTFAATAFAVTYVGATPVLVDSESQSYNLDPDLLAAFLASRAREGRRPAAVIVVDIYGQPADYDRLLPICAEFGVPVLEDAAEALGAVHRRGMAGSFGRAAIFSFNGNKIMTTSGGGMLVTNDKEIARRVRYLSTQARQPVPWYEHHDIGFNYRMSNVLAALGRAQLKRLPGFIEKRRLNRSIYAGRLASCDIEVLMDPEWGVGNGWLTVIRLAQGRIGPTQEGLEAVGIESRRAWKPLHAQRIFANEAFIENGNSQRLFESSLCLPSGSALVESDVESIADIVASASAIGS